MTYCSFCMEPIEPTYKVCPYCGKPTNAEIPAHHLLPGTILHEKFLVGAALGEGGFGITYIGRDLTLDIKVAIKEFYPNGYVNRTNTTSAHVTCSISDERRDVFDKGRERFLREARILAKFSSDPGVVEVRDFFEANNTAYIIMEYLDGEDLKHMLKAKGPMPADRVISLLMPVMKTLTKIHSWGLIHRDISPDNIRMCRGSAKLLDFGAARDVSDAANKSLSVMLKPGFAPEEQYRSRGNQGAWTDVYALCATMYVCITGITPDDATQRVFQDEVKRPSELGIAISSDIENAIMKGMAVKQEDRFRSVDELINALTGVAAPAAFSNDARAAAVDRAAAANVNAAGGAQYAAPAATSKPKKKNGKGIIIALIAILMAAAVGVGAYFLLNSDSGKDRDDDSTDGTGETAGIGETDVPNELSKIELTLAGDEFTIPCAYSDFIDKGWEVYTYSAVKEQSMLPPMSYTFAFFEKDGEDVGVLVYNDSAEAKAAKDCKIGNLDFYFSEFDAVLPGGISGIPTADEIIKAYGEPDGRTDGDEYIALEYDDVDDIPGKGYRFVCYEAEPEYSSVTVSNMSTVDLTYADPEDLEVGEDETPSEEPSDEPSEESSEAPSEEPAAPVAGEMSDDLFDFTFKLEGKVYQLPCDFTALTSEGWTISYGGTDEQQLASKSYVYLTMAKNGAKFTAYVYNLSGNAKAVKDCKVGFIDFHSEAGIELAKGITPLSTKEEVIAAFGEPTKETIYDNYVHLAYTVDGKPDTFANFYCYTERPELFSRIEIKNFIATESDKTETNSELPAYLASYKAPTALGSDMTKGIVSIEGDLYQLPAPVSEFTAKGWSITSKPGYITSGGNDSITLERDGKKLRVTAMNFADYQTIPENCAVTYVSVYTYDKVDVKLPGNITIGSAGAEVEAAPLPADTNNNNGFYSYYNYDNGENYALNIRVDEDSDKVSYITLSDKNWDH